MVHLQVRTNLLFATGPGELRVDLTVDGGSLVGIYGPSGSGKTTLLRVLAGLATPDEGRLTVDGQVWLDTGRRFSLSAQQRQVGMVFQDTALFPNMTVRENVQFAAGKTAGSAVEELLDRVELRALADRKPATLSGGQRQRVALIRALARRPRLLLLDEPFSALDAVTREQLLDELVRLHRQYKTTTLLVSHQQEEIGRVADRLIRLEQGKVLPGSDLPGSGRREDRGEALVVSGTILSIDQDGGQLFVRLRLDNSEITVPIAEPGDLPGRPGEVVRISLGGPLRIKKD